MQKKIHDELSVFKCITFEEKAHKYFIQNTEASKFSVTGLISKYKPKFDEDKWARIKAKSLNISVDEMKFIWSEKNLYSTTFGTELHQLIECVYKGVAYNFDSQKIVDILGDESFLRFKTQLFNTAKQFKSFFVDTKNSLTPISNELVVGDIFDSKVCGTLDMLAYNKSDKCLEIYDFKTNRAINHSSVYNEYYSEPLQDLEVCEYNTYSLQLSIYKYIIEKYTALKVKTLNIVWFNIDNSNYKIIKCKDLNEHVKLMFV